MQDGYPSPEAYRGEVEAHHLVEAKGQEKRERHDAGGGAVARGVTRSEAALPKMVNRASEITAPKTNRFPSSGAGPRTAPLSEPRTFSATIPSTDRTMPPTTHGPTFSLRKKNEIVPTTAGVVLVMTPPSAAVVKSRPHCRSTRNRKIPVRA